MVLLYSKERKNLDNWTGLLAARYPCSTLLAVVFFIIEVLFQFFLEYGSSVKLLAHRPLRKTASTAFCALWWVCSCIKRTASSGYSSGWRSCRIGTDSAASSRGLGRREFILGLGTNMSRGPRQSVKGNKRGSILGCHCGERITILFWRECEYAFIVLPVLDLWEQKVCVEVGGGKIEREKNRRWPFCQGLMTSNVLSGKEW